MARKPRVIRGFLSYAQAKLLQKVQLIIQCMTGNLNFPTPVPSIEDVTSATATFAQLLATPASKEVTLQKKAARLALIALLNQLASYVQLTTPDDAAALASSGFDLSKPGQRYGILPVPDNFTVVPAHPGIVKASAKKVAGASIYNFAYAPAPVTADSQWTVVQSSKLRTLISGLESGKQYAFKIAAVGADPTIVYGSVIYSFVI